MNSLFLFVFTFRFLTTCCKSCSSNENGIRRFGPNCGFMCHCKNNDQCDVSSGECESGCASMWFGPGCQYRDLAEGEFSRQSDNLQWGKHKYSVLAHDGNLNTCSYTAEANSSIKTVQPFWRVWLPTRETIRELIIITRKEVLENFQSFVVYVENVQENYRENNSFIPSDRQECFKHNNVAPESETINIECKTPVAGNQVRIELAALRTQLVLCDVKINGGRNLAFKQKTSQSSTVSTCKQLGGCTSNKAVDGVDSQSSWQQCSYTADERNPWWKLDIGHQAQIWVVQILPFKNEKSRYQSTLTIDVSNTTNGSWKTLKNTTIGQRQLNILLNSFARYVKLTKPGNPKRLQICEVNVFGDCVNNYWGPRCENKCGNCLNSNRCDWFTGDCPKGCKKGYNPPKCSSIERQSVECNNGKYGRRCSQTCPANCKEGTVCNKVNGHCDSGCRPGFLGDRCDKTCQSGYYGPNCKHRCSSNCYYTQCNIETGHCHGGCKPGYQGQTCDQVCDNGKYGLRCTQSCPVNCKTSTICNNVNGRCDLGCRTGFLGETCDRMCDNGKYGLRCTQSCPVNCREGTFCNKVNGRCDMGCRPGFLGDTCDIKCDDGKYGQYCSETCSSNCKNNTDCDKVNGTCYQGCKPGYKGENCEQALQVTDGPGGSIIGITAALTISFIISIAAAIAIVYMRRKRRHRAKERRGVVELAVSREEYVNSTATTSRQENCFTNQKSRESIIYTNAVYADVSKQSKSAIPISALADHFKTNSDRILDEFQRLPYGMQYPSTVGVKACNRGKNRYRDMYAYDHSRVVLDTLSGEEGSGYINACFIRGYLKEQAYIAAQGPVEATIDDFWRMVWEKDVTTIAMLTNLVEETKAKCLQYWPVVESSSNYGDFLVRTDSEIVFAEFTIREFHVSCGREPLRCIRQFHYTAWPDKSVPRSASSLLHFWRKVRKNDETKSHPWLVHCSAGVGRTGTFIATDILYDQAKAKDYVDIYQCVGDLREQRVNMVQTKGQYKFLYGLMTETFVVTPELVPLESFEKMVENLKELDSTTSKTKLFLEYKVLNQDSPYITSEDNNEDKYLAARLPINKDKNRCSDILPPNEFRPFLLTKLPNCSDYINAVYMPSYCETNCYILTQLPMKTTAIDCCRLVYEEDVKVIVTFDEKVKQEVGTYLPENGMIKFGPFTVLKKSEEDKNIYIKKMFIFSYGSEKREIIQLAFKAWTSSLLVPRNPHVMMKFIQEAEYYRRSYENKPVIVQCLNGSEKCGLYVAVVNVLERARFDNEVSIPQVIRELRVRREQIIPNFEQFKFCYDVLLCHIENDSMYANM